MPQSPSYRRDFESQKRLLEQELNRLYGSDNSELEWVRETLTRLESRRGDIGYSDRDRVDLNKARDILDRVQTIAAFYNPNQPRDAHGRWTSGGTLDVQKAVAKLERAGDRSLHQCAKYVREAIEAGGIVFKEEDLPKSHFAKHYGDTLEKYGFVNEAEASVGQGFPPNKSYTPKAGDVVVIQSTSTSPEGHMAMFSGKQWISDFKQREFWPGPDYREQKPSYVIYRR